VTDLYRPSRLIGYLSCSYYYYYHHHHHNHHHHHRRHRNHHNYRFFIINFSQTQNAVRLPAFESSRIYTFLYELYCTTSTNVFNFKLWFFFVPKIFVNSVTSEMIFGKTVHNAAYNIIQLSRVIIRKAYICTVYSD